ncbi:MAG TPA: putative LPS assembly protein LptD [Bryobacteraceae bacterium]|nr:putative LPS assembly protein LptD [Bryobacteraceae bacterium]
MFLFLTAISLHTLAWGQASNIPKKPEIPPQDEIWYHSITEDSNGEIRLLHGDAKLETSDFSLSADEIRYNSDTNWAHAQGHVHMEHFATGDKLNAESGDYNIKTQEGRFYGISGTAPAKVITSPGILTTSNPFYFQAQWGDRIKDRYILHHGFLTDCKMPKPWWYFEAPVFDVVPGQRAIAKRAVFRLHGLPVFFLPYFYHPLGKNPRSSGFLTPNIGHSSLYGFLYGAGYYWAINRSYDTSIIGQYFTARGPGLRYDLRGKPNESTDFNVNFYGVDDTTGTLSYTPTGNQIEKQGGEEVEVTASTQILGFTGRLDYNYLSSYLFREAFSYSFATTISSQNNSAGFLQRRFDNDRYSLDIAMHRNELYESVTAINAVPNRVVLQQFPAVEFSGRDQQFNLGPIPLWFSFNSSAGLLERQEPVGTDITQTTAYLSPTETFSTGPYTRVDAEPRIATAFNFKGFSLNPSVTFGVTDYSNYYSTNSTTYAPVSSCGGYPTCPPTSSTALALANASLFRKDADFVVDLRLPALERIYKPAKWLHLGDVTFKHVIEAEATYEYVTGVDNFAQIIHYDDTDLLSNTNQLTLTLTNRLYRKDKKGNVSEVLTWRVAQARYFDPTFGGAVLPNQRNIVLAAVELTPLAFLNGPRSYSPVVSTLNLNPYSFLSVEWRTNYDPLSKRFLDQTYGISVRKGKYFGGVSDTAIKTEPLLTPQANQISFGGGYGSTNRKGWNFSGSVFYDELLNRRLFDFVTATYNTDCCGFSFQLRNFNLGIRQENQYLFSFQVANIGSFGSLQKQNRNF